MRFAQLLKVMPIVRYEAMVMYLSAMINRLRVCWFES